MAVKFRCEHCGKRLQVAVGPGARAMCPYCRKVSVVPADAESYSDVENAAAPVAGPADVQDESLLDRVALYVPTWGTSVALHLSVALLALMGSWMAVTRPPPDVRYVIQPVPVSRPNFTPTQQEQGGALSPRQPQSQDYSSYVFKPTKNPVEDVADNLLPKIELIGIGGGGKETGGIPGLGPSRGSPIGWFVEFGQLTGGPKNIVYVIDRSGSMTDSIMYVKYELKRCIRLLRPRDQFHVIFYSSGPAVEMPMRRLLPATEANKLAAYEFIDGIVPLGQTDPSEALRAALALRPNTIFLLSDGEFEERIVNLVDKLNPAGGANNGRLVKVNTLCFIYTAGERILQTIADRNGGTYRFIGESDLEKVGGAAANTL
jgi:phage FluMu protein Com